MTKRTHAGARAVGTANNLRRSPCPVANTLDLIGDKWSLLVIRDLLLGKRTFGELLASPEGIPTNILADRLKRLEQAGVIESSAYQEHPPRYAYVLTAKGEALKEVLEVFVNWGKRFLPGTKTLQEVRMGAASGGGKTRSKRKH